jgi:ABC-2 type transport system ATP-binding protein
MDEGFAIKVDNVSKSFRLPHEKNTSLKSALINLHKRGYEKQEVLKDVDFEVKKGEFLGIVGRNGSGKSTLLKLLAGIYTPDHGEIHLRGKLTPFIELGVGFNHELTGRENVFLNGALLGFGRKEMGAMYNEIVEFAGLERFMDQKLKNYSSGMQVRLAFSIAIRARSDILLLDEVLAVGDAAFQRKCFNYFADLKRNKQTVIFISHDMDSVRKYCDRVIFLDKGEIQDDGLPEKVISKFTKLFIDELNKQGISGLAANDDLPLGMAPTSSIDNTKLQVTDVWIETGARILLPWRSRMS